MQDLLIDIKTMPQAFGGYHLLLVITCDQMNFPIAVPLRDRQAQTAAKFTLAIIHTILTMINCRLKLISPYNHGSSKYERQIKTISEIIAKHLWDKG